VFKRDLPDLSTALDERCQDQLTRRQGHIEINILILRTGKTARPSGESADVQNRELPKVSGEAAAIRLSWPERFAWMICAMPELLKSFSWDFFVLFFYAQVVGLNGWLLGVAIAVIIIFDTLVDPWIGALSDRMNGARFGKRHTLMLTAILPFMLGILGVFSPPVGMSQGQNFAWLLGFGLVARCGISFWTVPAYALGGELSTNGDERRLIAVMRNMGNQLIILTVPVIAFAVFFRDSPQFPRAQLNPAPYPGFGLFVSLLGGALMLVGALGTMRAARRSEALINEPREAAPTGLGAILGAFWQAIRITPNIGRLLMVAFLVLFTNSVINQFTLHLATYFWQLSHDWTPTMQVGATLGSILAMFLAPAWCRALGTRRAMMAGLGGFFVCQASVILLPLAGLAPAAGTTGIALLVLIARFSGGLAYGLYVVPFNVVTYDIGDEHEANTGRPAQGIVASFMFIGLQLGSGAVALLAGSFLGLIRFPANVPLSQMPADKVTALAWFVLGLITVAGSLMAWLVGTFRFRETAKGE
jgi:Na+/melibiose symporter-like transporter